MQIFYKICFNKNGKKIKKYKICGITILRKEKSLNSKKWTFCGMDVYEKNNISACAVQKSCVKVEFTKFSLIKQQEQRINFPKVEKPLVSIIIPVYNQYYYTNLCLQSILHNTRDISYEIIIADDNSTDETRYIEKNVSNIIISRNKENIRFLRNCNNAAQKASGKYIVFLNNDTQVQKGWLSALVHAMEEDNNIGLVGSKLIYPDGTLQEAGGIVYADATACNYGRNNNPNELKYNYKKEVDYISGASIMLKRSLWNELGGFDETFAPAYYEDTDLAFKVRYKKSLKVVYIPESLVVHFEGKSNGTDLSSGQKQYQIVNREKFYQKWKQELHKYHVNRLAGTIQARDRSQTKKNILVIDWKVLTYSKDTGSRTTWQYMQLFQNMGLNVTFYPHSKNMEEEYLREHLNNGFNVVIEDFIAYIQMCGKYFDYVYVNRPGVACSYLDVLRKYTRAKIIYQCHDLHYLRQYRDRLLLKTADAEECYKVEKEFEYNIFRKADVTCTFSYDEVVAILKEDKYINAQQIPLYILNSEKMNNYKYQAQERENIMFVAGFQHKPNNDAAVWFVRNIFPEIKKKIHGVKLYLVGSNPTEQVVELQCKDVIVTGFVTDEELEEYYSKIKLVVVPLRSGAGVKGKIIEAIYHKVPVITTDIGIEGINNEEGIIDIKNTVKEFVDCVVSRYEDNEFLNRQSLKFKAFISRYFSTEAALKSLEDYIQFPKH